MLECFPTAWGHGDSNTIGCSGWLGSCDQAYKTWGWKGRFGRRRSSQPGSAHTGVGAGHRSEPEEGWGPPQTSKSSNAEEDGESAEPGRWCDGHSWTHTHVQAAAQGVCAAWKPRFYSWWPLFRSQLDVDIKYIPREKRQIITKKWWNVHRFCISWTLKPKVHVSAQEDSQLKVLFPGSSPETHKGNSFLQQAGCWFLSFQTGSPHYEEDDPEESQGHIFSINSIFSLVFFSISFFISFAITLHWSPLELHKYL